MFAYFPGNYVWNLAVCIALESGAQIGEIDEMCAPLRAAAAQGDDPGTTDFLQSWVAMGDKLIGLADEDAAAGHGFAAADKLDRAALYYQIAERMQVHGSPERATVFGHAIDAFTRSIELGGLAMERVEIPYLDGVIPGWFRRADRGDGSTTDDGVRQWTRQHQGDARLELPRRRAGQARREHPAHRPARHR